MNYVLHEDPGPESVKVAYDAFQGLQNVKTILFTTNKLPQGKLGLFVPETQSVIIDLTNVLNDLGWSAKGMFLSHCVWCNLLYTIYHEAAHAWQFQQEGWDALPEDADLDMMEQEARKIAMDKTMDWLCANSVPKIPQMGWVGEQLTKSINLLFAMGNLLIEEEVRMIGTPASGRADAFTQLNGGFDDAGKMLLFDRIDGGSIGHLKNGVRYLTATEIIGANMEVTL